MDSPFFSRYVIFLTTFLLFELPVLSEKDVHWNRAAMTSSCVSEILLTWRQSRLGRKLEEDVLLERPMAPEWNDKRVK